MWRSRAARLILLSTALGSFGFGLNLLAVGQILYELTGSAQSFALLLVGQSLGAIAILPVAGPLVDTLPARGVYAVSGVLRSALVVGMVFASAPRQAGGTWLIVVLAVLAAMCNNVQRVAMFRLVSESIDGEIRVKVNSASNALFQVGVVAGMAVLGLFMSAGTVRYALYADAAAGVLGAFAVLAIVTTVPADPEPRSTPMAAARRMVQDWRGMLVRYRRVPLVAGGLVLCSADFLMANALSTLVVPMVNQGHPDRLWYISLLEGAFGVGVVVAFFLADRCVRKRLLPVWLGVQAVMAGLLCLTLPVLAAVAVFLVAGFANVCSLVYLLSALQERAAEGDRGKMGSLRLGSIGLVTAVALPFVGGVSEVRTSFGFGLVAAAMVAFTILSVWVLRLDDRAQAVCSEHSPARIQGESR